MTLSDLQTLIEYHVWARGRMLDGVEPLAPEQFTRDLGNSFKSIQETVTHLYFADWVWLKRWQGDSPAGKVPIEQFVDVAAARRAWSEHDTKLQALVDGLGEAGVNRVFQYQMINGSSGSSPFWQMLQHLVNHGSYHRGQVTTMLRQMGVAPPKSMDMIAFYRENPR
jgi:uncharacterized damage-inducible protein DinB